MNQTFSMNGQIKSISEPKGIHTKAGKFFTLLKFTMLQHTDDSNEVPRSFAVQDKYTNCLNGFRVGDHVRVFFYIKTINNDKGFPTTYFNVFKVEEADAPALNAKANYTAIENTDGFNPNQNLPH